jgi:biotin transport system permease protein
MIALYRAGSSILHRLPAGVKLTSTMLLVFVVSLIPHTWWSLAVIAAVTVAGYLIAGLGVAEVWRQVLAIRWLIVFALTTQLLFLSAQVALINVSRITTVIVLAALLTLTTRTADLLTTTERALAPLRRVGVNPHKVGLTLAITITTIPVLAAFATTVREAQMARGARTRLHTAVVPLMVMSLKHADELSEAMIARGLD